MNSIPNLSYIIMMLTAGGLIAFQPAINAALSKAIQSLTWAGALSLTIGALCLLILNALIYKDMPVFNLKSLKPWMFLGGILGAFYMFSSTLCVQKLGSAATMTLFMCGQMAMVMVIDHFGFFGIAPYPITLQRVLAIGLMVTGVYLMQKA
jgi:transporter family-2 protein